MCQVSQLTGEFENETSKETGAIHPRLLETKRVDQNGNAQTGPSV